MLIDVDIGRIGYTILRWGCDLGGDTDTFLILFLLFLLLLLHPKYES